MSNSRPKATLEIDLADLPMVAHGLSIMRATAMPGMCGSERHHARADAYYKKFLAQLPPVVMKFDEYKFCDIVLRVDKWESYTLSVEPISRWSDKYQAVVTFANGAKYASERWATKQEAEQIAKEMQELLDQIQPL